MCPIHAALASVLSASMSTATNTGHKAWCVVQPAPGPRVKDKFVSLPDELEDAAAPTARQHLLDLPSTVFEVRLHHESHHENPMPIMSMQLHISKFLPVSSAGYPHRPAS